MREVIGYERRNVRMARTVNENLQKTTRQFFFKNIIQTICLFSQLRAERQTQQLSNRNKLRGMRFANRRLQKQVLALQMMNGQRLLQPQMLQMANAGFQPIFHQGFIG